LLAAAAAIMALSACGVEPAPNAEYQASSCRRIALVDTAAGAAVVGAEDLALDIARGQLIVSAYDRRAVERAAGQRAFSLPEGGLYRVAWTDLLDEDGTAQAHPLIQRGRVAGGLRPHGFVFDSRASEIAFVNRGYQKIDGRWRMTARIERVGIDGTLAAERPLDAPCAANDVVAGVDGLAVSFDHADCGWRAALEDALKLKQSGLAHIEGAPLFTSAAFANGAATLPSGDIALAATRENALLVLERNAHGYDEARRIALPGGPDNVTANLDGSVVAAVHPAFLRLALHRRLGIGSAPSRVVKADPATGAVTTLFDDPGGGLFSAATAAVEHEGALVLGSATDAGLLVCTRGQ
jgi:hypothetical protein